MADERMWYTVHYGDELYGIARAGSATAAVEAFDRRPDTHRAEACDAEPVEFGNLLDLPPATDTERAAARLAASRSQAMYRLAQAVAGRTGMTVDDARSAVGTLLRYATAGAISTGAVAGDLYDLKLVTARMPHQDGAVQ